MNFLENTVILSNIFFYCCLGAAVMIVFTIVSAVFQKKRNAVRHIELKEEQIDLLKYPRKKIVKPIIPCFITLWGILCFFVFFGLSGLIFINSELPNTAVIVICFFLGVAAEVAASNLKYAHNVRRPDAVFVPKMVGYTAKVSKDVPAGKRGEGLIRLMYGGVVTEIRALSVDEVTLASGTDVVIMYADSDCSVVVERKK